jgi:cytochrome c-type biogenesis protein CcmF
VVAAIAGVALAIVSDAGSKPWALALFTFATFALVGLSQEFWRGAAARRSLKGGSMASALVGVVSRNRRRYGGYIVHIGIAVLLIGIAASSSFQTKRDVNLRPGQSAVVDGRKITYVRPTAKVDKLALTIGAILRIAKGDEAFTLHPTRRFYRPTGSEGGGGISNYFAGESDSEIGLKAGLFTDFWTANQPNIVGLQRHARAADQGFSKCVRGGPGVPSQCRAIGAAMQAALANPQLRPQALAKIEQLQLETAKQIAAGYVSEGAPSTFRVIVNPLVTWMWIGGLIALAGALIGLWPTRRGSRSPVADTELEAQKEAKYREIRDAELDHAAGKLSDEDFALLDAELRKEAIEILDSADGNGTGPNGHREKVGKRPAEPV